MKIRTSPGPDSWRVAELRALPLVAWTELATILNEAESTGSWPTSLLDGVTTLIPKDAAAQLPLKLRPISVLSCIYRCWASHRVQDLSEWLQEVMPVHFQAYLKGRSAKTAAARLALLMEEHQLPGQPPLHC
eukprot:5404510-Amphidinium_carterae.1